ncbi:hypothetical protein HMI54_008773 [Coelomomyces lativittatus]|nr:hypothetical protein HMI54_008773 [Coelomomyces lativittatus]
MISLENEKKEPLVKSRIQLERYLFMSTYPVTIRAYMIGRILELAEGSHLAAYRWDAGGGGASTSGSSTLLPTDAELVLHVFCTWMDSQMPGANRGLTAYSPFTVKYFRPVDEKSDLLDHLHIQMSVSRPPHFRLCQKRTIYDVFPVKCLL